MKMSSALSLSTSMTFWSTNFSTALAGSSMSDIFPEQLLRVGLCHTYTCLAEIKKKVTDGHTHMIVIFSKCMANRTNAIH